MEANIPVTIVADAAVAMIMEQVDMVIVGAEAVVESGGIVNRTGSSSWRHRAAHFRIAWS